MRRFCVGSPSGSTSLPSADCDHVPPGADWLVLAERAVGPRHLLAGEQPLYHRLFLCHQGLRELLLKNLCGIYLRAFMRASVRTAVVFFVVFLHTMLCTLT